MGEGQWDRWVGATRDGGEHCGGGGVRSGEGVLGEEGGLGGAALGSAELLPHQVLGGKVPGKGAERRPGAVCSPHRALTCGH